VDPIRTIGSVLRGDEQRDAIHIAIMPVVCGEDYLSAGDEVGLVYGTTNVVKRKNSIYGIETIGVIDPFLGSDIDTLHLKKGDVVWCFLKPGTITGLRHEWTHPGIDNQRPPKNEAERWLRAFAGRWNFIYDEMIAEATAPLGPDKDDYHYVVARGIDLHSREELGDDHALFWQHLQTLTGYKFDQAHIDKFVWSCSC